MENGVLSEARMDTEAVGRSVDEKKPKLSAWILLKEARNRRAMLSAVATLTLGILGGGVLPVAWAFSVTGIVAGFLIMLIVAAANAFTCDLLLRQAHHTGSSDYETLGFSIGGRWWRLTTEISIVVLMLGTIVGGIAQVGEAAAMGLTSIWPNSPGVLVNGSGRFLMVLATLFIIAPLCLVRHLRQLEYAGIVGTIILLWLMVVTIIDSSKHGLPAIADQELPVVGFSSIRGVTQTVSIFGFAFFIQPIMMPLLLEMPEGHVGIKLISSSTRIVVLGNAFVIYGLTGFFGAAYYGANTQQNILVNQWLGGGVPQGILNLFMTFYLAIANPTLEFPTRHTIYGWIPANRPANKLIRHLMVTTFILGFSLTIAVIWPSQSGYLVVATGATGVCMVSYIIPVVNHLLLYFSRAKCQRVLLDDSSTSNVERKLDYRRERKEGKLWVALEYLGEISLPILVLLVGLFCSIAALTTL